MKKPKILWYTCMQGRQEIVDIMLAGFNACKEHWKHDIEMDIFITASEDEDVNFLDQRNIYHSQKPNNPVGLKFSRGLKDALVLDWDYIMILGSDDVISPELFAYYLPEIEKETPYFGTDAICIVDYSTQRAKNFTIPPNSIAGVCGPGRMVSRDIVNHFDGYLWSGGDKGLDMLSNTKITSYAPLKALHLQSEDVPLMWDIKSPVNIWAYDKIVTPWCVETSYNEQLERMPEQCKILIDERRKQCAV